MNIIIKKMYFYYWLFRTKKFRKEFPKYSVLSTEQTIEEIINHKRSISRFGDGEFILLMRERGIYFQELTEHISIRLEEVITTPIPHHIVTIPDCFVRNNDLKHNARVHWISFINSYGKKISTFLDSKRIYGNTQMSRFYMDYLNKDKIPKIVRKLKTIWDNKDVLIIEGEFSRLGIGNDFFSNTRSIERIICPSKNAYRKYNDILEKAEELGKDKLIIIALGPTATILSYDLAKKGYWALDLGHIDIEYSWFLMKAESKIPVKGKNSAEVESNPDLEIDTIEKKKYEESVKCKLL